MTLRHSKIFLSCNSRVLSSNSMSLSNDAWHRAFTTTPDDHSGIAMTMTTLFMTWSVLCYFIRIYTRFGIAGSLGLDDLFCSLATLSGIVQTVLSCASINRGFGKSVELLSQVQINGIEKIQYGGALLYIITLFLGKCAMVFFYARITSIKKHRFAGHILLASLCCWVVASLITQGLRCEPRSPWQLTVQQCPDFLLGWKAIAAFDVLSELFIFAMSIWLVWGIQMPLQKKRVVVFAFSLRLPMVIPAIMHITSLETAFRLGNLSLTSVLPFIYAQVEMHFGTMATTIPCLKPFIKSFNTGWGTVIPNESGSYALADLSYKSQGANSAVRRTRAEEDLKGITRSSLHAVTQPRRFSEGSDDSQKMIIRKTVSTNIDYDAHRPALLPKKAAWEKDDLSQSSIER